MKSALIAIAIAAAPTAFAATEETEAPAKLVVEAAKAESAIPIARPAEDVVLEGAAAKEAPASSTSAVKSAAVPESAIPVSIEKKDEKKASGDPIQRALFGAVALAAALGAVVFAMKKYAKRGGGLKQNAKIQVLGQHYLGPKKSLAIVHVAGESILIGVTDNNISLIKTLALIDDEVPTHLPNTFDGAMEDDEAFDDYDAAPSRAREAARPAPQTDDYGNFAMRGLNEIRDVVSGRIGAKGSQRNRR